MDDLIERARRGDSRAFAMLFERYKLALWKVSLAVMSDENDASDALQETALRAWRAMPTFEGRSDLRTWLTRIISRVCFDMLRVRRQEFPLSSCPSADALSNGGGRGDVRADELNVLVGHTAFVDRDESLDVKRAMQALPPDDRTVLTLFYLNDYPVRRIASVLGVSEGAVKTRLTRARERFRALYEDEPNNETGVS